MAPRPLLKSSCSLLDEAMDGGLRSGDIVQVYGPSGVGKTTLALQYALNVARQGARTVYVDAEGTFPITRLRQLASDDFETASRLISIISPANFTEQAELVSRLEDICTPGVQLLVVDTVVSRYRKELGELEENILMNRLLNRQLGMIVALVQQRPITVLLINQVRGVIQGQEDFIPVANSIISYWCTSSIRIKKAESLGYREFKLTKNNFGEPIGFVVRLSQSGFK